MEQTSVPHSTAGNDGYALCPGPVMYEALDGEGVNRVDGVVAVDVGDPQQGRARPAGGKRQGGVIRAVGAGRHVVDHLRVHDVHAAVAVRVAQRGIRQHVERRDAAHGRGMVERVARDGGRGGKNSSNQIIM